MEFETVEFRNGGIWEVLSFPVSPPECDQEKCKILCKLRRENIPLDIAFLMQQLCNLYYFRLYLFASSPRLDHSQPTIGNC